MPSRTPVAPTVHRPLVSCFTGAAYPSVIPKHRRYPSKPRTQGFIQPKGCSESIIIIPAVVPRADSHVVPQPYAAIYMIPACRKHVNEHAPMSPMSAHRLPGVLCEANEVFDRSSVPFASRPCCGTLCFVPSLPAHLASSARHEYTSSTVTSPSTSSYPARTDPSTNGRDIGVSSTPST